MLISYDIFQYIQAKEGVTNDREVNQACKKNTKDLIYFSRVHLLVVFQSWYLWNTSCH